MSPPYHCSKSPSIHHCPTTDSPGVHPPPLVYHSPVATWAPPPPLPGTPSCRNSLPPRPLPFPRRRTPDTTTTLTPPPHTPPDRWPLPPDLFPPLTDRTFNPATGLIHILPTTPRHPPCTTMAHHPPPPSTQVQPTFPHPPHLRLAYRLALSRHPSPSKACRYARRPTAT
ncbi:hypothetical protein CesoFtcFv8_021424 [Champsocephalus esox]|uniref:Uncharacterized protein n=1 Tax=Champsocephalus esox TaxID=159716 RepID=A0AAN8BDQ8_9TELE|nr:hypothetical protein CesoFtcFv8_021424 [Champsocephalus esox]